MARTSSGIANVAVMRPSVARSSVSMTERYLRFTGRSIAAGDVERRRQSSRPPQSNDWKVQAALVRSGSPVGQHA